MKWPFNANRNRVARRRVPYAEFNDAEFHDAEFNDDAMKSFRNLKTQNFEQTVFL
jgi:hypothetical protein